MGNYSANGPTKTKRVIFYIRERFAKDKAVFFSIFLVTLNEYFVFERPLTVTGVFLSRGGELLFNQMLLDRVENNKYILQNNLHTHSPAQLRIPLKDRYYNRTETQEWQTFDVHSKNIKYGTKIRRQNRSFNIIPEEWYLLPEAYSIILVPRE